MNKVNVLGVGVSAINIPLALETIDYWITQQEHHYICITGVHGVMESQQDIDLKRIHNCAGMVTPDGMPLVWIGRSNGFSEMSRVYGPDLMLAVCAASAEKGYKHFFYGGAEDVPELLKQSLQQQFPGLQVVGAYSPPFRPLTPEEDANVIQMIDESKADIVWVGLSTPKQERWMAAHLGKIKAPVMIGVGAAFDFHSGLKTQAPLWMQRNGLEWFFRLVTEPKRLWKRYLSNNPRFVGHIFLQRTKLRKYDMVR